MIKPELARRLDAAGLDLVALRGCLRAWCRKDRGSKAAGVALQNSATAALAQALGPQAVTALIELARGLDVDVESCC